MEFVVEIERTEKYFHKVIVEAKDKNEAVRKVSAFESNDGFSDTWNELQPSVDTEYVATEKDMACLTEGEEKCLEVVK